ncbi:MAG: hypothetical protein AABW79_04230 [Nanoarchaeota archaeon]
MDVIVEALRDGGIVKVTEQEAKEEGLIILRRPLIQQTYIPPSRAPGKSAEARENMRHSIIDLKTNNVRGDLIENFHWTISKGRRLKNLTRHQLANLLNVSEEQIIAIENGKLPKDDYILISKLESYLAIKLRKASFAGVAIKSVEIPSARVADSQKSYPQDITLAGLQKRKEMAKKMEPGNSKKLFGDDIQLIE